MFIIQKITLILYAPAKIYKRISISTVIYKKIHKCYIKTSIFSCNIKSLWSYVCITLQVFLHLSISVKLLHPSVVFLELAKTDVN